MVVPDIQNEMLEMVHRKIMEAVLPRIRKAGMFSIIADETMDASIQEQMSIVIRFFDIDELEVCEEFLGFYNVVNTEAETLLNTIKDVLQQCDLPLAQARGQCYDGAANMRGHVNGVQARLLKENPHCLYVYCMGHKLNLVVQDATRALVEGSMAMSLLQACTNYIRDSPRRLQEFNEVVSGLLPYSNTDLRPLCHTRWVMRFRSLDSFIEKYPALLQWFEERREEASLPADSRARAMSFLQELEKFETFFVLRAMRLLFGIVEPVHKAVQGVNEKIGDVKRKVNMLKENLHSVLDGYSQTGDAAEMFFQVTKKKAIELQIDIPALPRVHSKMRRRYTSSTINPMEISEDDIINHYSILYRSLFDAAITAIDSRYHSPSMERAAILETVFTSECTPDNVEKVCELYGLKGSGDINDTMLKIQVDQWISLAAELKFDCSANGFLEMLKEDKTRVLFMKELFKVLQLYTTLPCTTCAAERSFSCLRRIKNYLRTTMTQQRLNHIAGIYIHKHEMNKVNRAELLDVFVSKNQLRKNKFATVERI